jgi:hypothetical protein
MSLNEMPIEFTRWASAKPKDLFRHAVDFLVQLRLNPAFPKRDDIYRVTWQKLDDQVQGLVGSKFSSSVWKREFYLALHARPNRVTAEMNAWDENCEACGRSGHPATRRIRFFGAPYERWGLEDLEQKDEDEEAGVVRDGQGREVPAETKAFSLGKHCFQNATAAHTLEHWRRDLRDEVWKRLEGLGELAPAKILERDKLNGKKRREYANTVVDRMETAGMIKELYQVYKDTIEQARTTKVGSSLTQVCRTDVDRTPHTDGAASSWLMLLEAMAGWEMVPSMRSNLGFGYLVHTMHSRPDGSVSKQPSQR